MIVEVSRPLSKREANRYRERARRCRQENPFFRGLGIGCGLILVLIFVVVWLKAGFFDSLVAFAFLCIFASVFLQVRRDEQKQAEQWEELLERGTVVEIQILSSRCFVVEEYDDEGSDYFFDIGDRETIVLNANEVASTSRLSSSEIKITRYMVGDGKVAEERIKTGGHMLQPVAVITRGKTWDGPTYETLRVIPRPLDELLAEQQEVARAGSVNAEP